MASLYEITSYLDDLLNIRMFTADYSNNGLQVEGSKEVKKIVFGVDASLEIMEKAADLNADLIFTHHGLSWGDNLKYLTSINSKKVGLLMRNNISLYAAHLPLDAHPVIGHNAILANMLHLENKISFGEYHGINLGFAGEYHSSIPVVKISELISQKISEMVYHCTDKSVKINPNPYVFNSVSKSAKKVGVISGNAGVSGVVGAAFIKADCYLCGEFGHTEYLLAKEYDISVIAPGHYLTEIPGVVAVMHELKRTFDIETEFIYLPTGF